MEQAVYNTQRRQSRQIILEDALRFGITEASRRHSMHLGARKSLVLPSISNPARQYRRKQRTKSIAKVAIYGDLMEENNCKVEKPLKLPKIYPKRTSIDEAHWHLPARRISKINDKLIVNHLRSRLLLQHERRVSAAYEESKEQEEDEESIDSRESYDGEIQSLRAMRYRTSLSSMQATCNEDAKQHEKSPESLVTPIASRPSICVSSDTGFTDWVNFNDRPEVRPSKITSNLRKSIDDSERSAMLLLEQSRRRSVLPDIPERNQQNEIASRHSISPSSLNGRNDASSPIAEPKIRSPRWRTEKGLNPESDSQAEVPIGEVNLFADWKEENATALPGCERLVSELKTPDGAASEQVSRQDTFASEVSITLSRKSSSSDLTEHCQESDSNNNYQLPQFEEDLAPQDRIRMISQIYLGDVNIPVPKLTRKVCLYISSSGTDSSIERRIVHEVVTPRLHHFCRERDLCFEIIDFNLVPREILDWPTTHDVTELLPDQNHTLIDLRHHAMQRSQNEGLGPKFMCFFGDSGREDVIVPASLSVDVFDAIMCVIDDEETELEMQVLQMSRTAADSSNQKDVRGVFSARPSKNLPCLNLPSNGTETCDVTSVMSLNQECQRFEPFLKRPVARSVSSSYEATGHSRLKTTSENKQLALLRAKLRQVKEQRDLLKSWYLLDTNSLPPVYKLRPLGSEFKFYSCPDPSNQQPGLDKRARERQHWSLVQQQLRKIILHFSEPERLGHDNCQETGILRKIREEVFVSAIFRDSSLAMARGDAGGSCFWYRRKITNLSEAPANVETTFFLPVSEDRDTLDLKTIEANRRLQDEITDKVGYASIREYPLLWEQVRSGCLPYGDSEVNNGSKRGWTLYLQRLRLDFYNICTTQIKNAVEKLEMKEQDRDYATEEVYEHVKFLQSLSGRFVGREGTLRSIQSYIKSTKNNKPFTVFGPCGCGKSAVMSKSAMLTKGWLKRKVRHPDKNTLDRRVLFRSIGITGESRHPRLLLASLCAQLCSVAADMTRSSAPSSRSSVSDGSKSREDAAKHKDYDFRELSARFKHLLAKCATGGNPLVLFLDNIEGLLDEHGARKLLWLPTSLPLNVKIVVSLTEVEAKSQQTTDDTAGFGPATTHNIMCDCFEIMKSRCAFQSDGKPDWANCVRIGNFVPKRSSTSLAIETVAFPESECEVTPSQLIDVMLMSFQRTLTKEQRSAIESKCACASPLAVSICSYLSTGWRSTDALENYVLDLPASGENIEEFVHTVFKNLEKKHGLPLVAATSCFLTSSLHGLTDADMRQLLARDKAISDWLDRVVCGHDRVVVGAGKREPPKKAKAKTEKSRPRSKMQKKSRDVKTKGNNVQHNCWKVVPDAVWQAMLFDLKFFVIESCSDHLMTYKWRHRIFSSVCKIRYMAQKEKVDYFHDLLASYFNSSFTSTVCLRGQDPCQPLQWERRAPPGNDENVQTSPAPLLPVHNLRRLNEAPYHYLQCRTVEDTKRDLICNYEWLLAKLRGTSYEFLVENLSSILLHHPDDLDLKLLAAALHLSRSVLKSDPCQLAAHLVGRIHSIIKKDKPLARLDPRKYPHCRVLLGQCKRSSTPVLVPSGTCLVPPGEILHDLHRGHCDVITAIALTTDGHRVLSTSKDKTLKIWDFYTGAVAATFDGVARHVTSLVTCMGNNSVAIVTASSKVEVRCLRTFSNLLTFHDPEDTIRVSAAGDGQTMLIIVSNLARKMKVYDLEKVRLLHKIDINPDHQVLRNDQSVLLARSSHGNNVLVSFHSSTEAYVYNARRAKHLSTMKVQAKNKYVLIMQVEVSREYYVIACKRQYMHLHEMVVFELYDAINYGHVRSIRACPEDVVSDFFVNRLGSHVVALCKGAHGSEIGVWNIESGKHQHLPGQKSFSVKGLCIDLQHCVTISDAETTIRVHNLASKIDDRALGRPQVKAQANGIGEFYPVTNNSRYVVARGIDNGPITVWNINRGRCKGEAVSIERGLHEQNDVIVVKDFQVVVLSDRGITSIESGSKQVFKTIYVYDLRTKKYSRKLHPVAVTICPEHEYFILGVDRLLAVSQDRKCFVIWSLITGHQISPRMELDFSKYEAIEKKGKTKANDRKWTKKGKAELQAHSDAPHKTRSGGSPFHLSEEERNRLIDQVMLSSDENTLLCSFYGRHVAVFDVEHHRHVHTLSNKDSMLLLHQAKMTYRGCHLVHTNYDDVAKTSYLTVWNLRQGCVTRRLKNEPLVCGLAISDNATRVVFATEDNFIKIWDPFRRGGHRKIAGYEGLRIRGGKNQTRVFLMKGATRAVVFADDVSLWDLERCYVISKFTPDVPFQCCTVAMDGQLIVVGLRDAAQVVTLRLMSRDHDAKQFGRAALGEGGGVFGELSERDSESSGDEDALEQG